MGDRSLAEEDCPIMIYHWARPTTALYAHDLIGVVEGRDDLARLDSSYERLVSKGYLKVGSDIIVLPVGDSVAIRRKYRLTEKGQELSFNDLPVRTAERLATGSRVNGMLVKA